MRFLFGPTTKAFAEQHLAELRADGLCLAFGTEPGLDLQLGEGAAWSEVEAKLPAGWKPNAIVLHLPYSVTPAWCWLAPLPRVGWAAEAALQWGAYRQVLPRCDVVIIDRAGTEQAKALGCATIEASTALLEKRFLEEEPEATPRDIDLLCVGNLHPAVQRERLPWLARLARLGVKMRVHIASGVPAAEYPALLRRARTVVDLSRQGHASRRVLEAAASGALVLASRHCADLLPELVEGEDWVLFDEADFEAQAEAALADETRRAQRTAAARIKAADFTFRTLWRKLEPALQERLPVSGRPLPADEIAWSRGWQTLYSSDAADAALAAEAEQRAFERRDAAWASLAASLMARAERAKRPEPERMQRILAHLRFAVGAAPALAPAHANLAEALALAGEVAAAAQQARHVLRLLESPEADVDTAIPSFPARFDPMRVENDQLAWRLHGDAPQRAAERRRLLCWRAQALLNELTGDLVHAYEAVRARPDLASTQASLGLALARSGHVAPALEPLRQAVALNPLDQVSASALHHALGALGLKAEQVRLAEDRRLLHLSASRLVPPEPWFAPRASAPRAEAGLVSIVIPCCNGRADTEGCVASLLAHTSSPFEMVFVDNGSTDGTAEFVQRLRDELGAEGVRLVRNETNLGFPKGCNQGAAAAQGEFLLFLNNDTLVTPGWLPSLLRPMADAGVGMAGPMSNHAPPPQETSLGYADMAGLDRFAEEWRGQHAGEMASIARLSGFCLLVRRELFQALGGFDERFGLGFFDDDDLSKRVREQGKRLILVKEAYIHHHGGRTFTGLGLDRETLLDENKAKFIEKWGPGAMEGYRLVHLPAARPPAQAARRRVSLTMIVKNEEANLGDCLRSLRDLVDEAVIADTGSQDRTREIALSFNAKVVSFPWIDHFGAARNAALAPATGDWVLWTDADDRFDEDNRAKLKKLFAELPAPRDAYAFKVRSALDTQSRAVRLLDQVRLFPRHPQVKWDYRIHEQILPAVRRRGGEVRWTDVVVDHVGYVDPRVRGGKLRRNIRLLRLDEAERPNDSFTLFNLGWTLLDLGETEEAILRLKRSLDHAAPDSSILRKIYGLLTQAHRQIKKLAPALELVRQGRCRCPDDLELPFEEALILRDLGDLAGAERCVLQMLAIPERQFFASVDPELKPVRSRVLLAELARRQGRLDDAVRYVKDGLSVRRRHVPLWLEWAEVCLAAKDWPGLGHVAGGLAKEASQPAEAEILLARAERAQGNLAAARLRLDRVIAHLPNALGPRVFLSHLLLQEGKDMVAAEAALQEILRLDPDNRDAKDNLRRLRRNGPELPAAPSAAR